MSENKVSKADYLKRYMSGDAQDSKKKKRRKKGKDAVGLKIVDDDFGIQLTREESQGPCPQDDEGPTVAEFIDERPEHVKILETFRTDNRWKVIADEADVEKSRQDSSDSSDPDQSPQRNVRHDTDTDSEPEQVARKSVNRTKGSDIKKSKNKRTKGKVSSKSEHRDANSESDEEPGRQGGAWSDSDQSPPRQTRNVSDDSDLSPPRRRANGSDSDQSPPRKRPQDRSSHQRPQEKRRIREPEALSVKPTETLGGAKAGLSSAKDMRKEAEKMKKAERERFEQLGDEALGRGAKTVFRDKQSGKKRDMAAEEAVEAEKRQKQEQIEHRYAQWNKGLAQQQQQDVNKEAALHEASKPMARYGDDVDLDARMRERERLDDPMLAYIKKKKTAASANAKPRYKGREPPPNRFGIWPGYRWDGVDRSNGFEEKMFRSQADRKATASIAYKWGVEEM